MERNAKLDQMTEKSPKQEQKDLDNALDDSFPASDPPSQTDPTKGVICDKAAVKEMGKQAEAKTDTKSDKKTD